MIPDKHPAIVLKDISYKHLQLVLQYAYCGNVDVASEDIEGFEKVLESLKIEYDIEGPDDGEDFSDDDSSSNTGVTPNVGEIAEPGEYSEMDIEEPKWSEVTVKQEPKDEDDDKSAIVASTSTATKPLVLAPKPETASNSNPVPRFIKITNQSNQSANFKQIVMNQRANITVSKLITPEMKQNAPRPSLVTRPDVQRPANLQQFKRIINLQKPSTQQETRFQSSPGGKLEGKIHLGRVVPSKILQKFMNENPGICPFCKKQFKTPKHRNEHVKYCFQNPNRIVSVCPLCDKNVCDPYYLRKHMKNVHGNDTISSSGRDSS